MRSLSDGDDDDEGIDNDDDDASSAAKSFLSWAWSAWLVTDAGALKIRNKLSSLFAKKQLPSGALIEIKHKGKEVRSWDI
jgi:hypothetical protein